MKAVSPFEKKRVYRRNIRLFSFFTERVTKTARKNNHKFIMKLLKLLMLKRFAVTMVMAENGEVW